MKSIDISPGSSCSYLPVISCNIWHEREVHSTCMQSVMRRVSSPVARCDRCREPIGYPLNPKCLRTYLGFCIETLCDLGYDTIGFKYIILCSTPYCVESKDNHGGCKLAGTCPPSRSKNIIYIPFCSLSHVTIIVIEICRPLIPLSYIFEFRSKNLRFFLTAIVDTHVAFSS